MFLKAAAQGDPFSEYFLGTLYERGVGVPQDDKEALKWYQKAATRIKPAYQAMINLKERMDK